MKNFLTSCYGRAKHLPRETTQVQISRGVPEWWNPERKLVEPDLAPSAETLAMAKGRTGDWRAAYLKELQIKDYYGTLIDILDRLPDGACLLCFEADHKECHRKVLADFLNARQLANVTEFVPPTPKVEPAEKQGELL